ncbi:MAG: Gfo/Idh/MocA family oxidoreductase [Janthinobacterium lividum]
MIRLVLLGAGLIGREHAKLVAAHPGATLVAVADPSAEARAFAEAKGLAHFAEYEAMLDATRPDGTIVALPNQLHLPAGLACIRRGIPCLMEKPVADTLAAARSLAEASEAAGVPVLVGHHRRHSPDIAEARRLVQAGALGDLVAVSGLCLFNKNADYFDAAWRREPGGGPLLINLIHDIDSLRFICGEIDAVQAFTSSAARGFAVEDTASLTLRFAGGALGSFVISDSVVSPWSWEFTSGQALYFPPQPGAYLFLGGRTGSLSVSDMKLWRHARAGGDWRDPVVPEVQALPATHAYDNQLDHFLAVIGRQVQPLITARDGMATLAATLAIAEAARSGRQVDVPGFLAAH